MRCQPCFDKYHLQKSFCNHGKRRISENAQSMTKTYEDVGFSLFENEMDRRVTNPILEVRLQLLVDHSNSLMFISLTLYRYYSSSCG